MSEKEALSVYYKKRMVEKQLALQSLSEIQKQITVAADRMALLSRYHQDYSADLDGVILNGTTVNDFQYFFKFMNHLDKVLNEAKVHLSHLMSEKDILVKNYEKIKRECDELVRLIEMHHQEQMRNRNNKFDEDMRDQNLTRVHTRA